MTPHTSELQRAEALEQESMTLSREVEELSRRLQRLSRQGWLEDIPHDLLVRLQEMEAGNMAIRKSELYSTLWASCDALRGGMDASQYKDYVLVLLFVNCISDKYSGHPYAPLVIPEGSGFADMVALKGKAEIDDRINNEIIAPMLPANQQLSQSDFPDFNDQAKLSADSEN